jgi:hypothetical protein
MAGLSYSAVIRQIPDSETPATQTNWFRGDTTRHRDASYFDDRTNGFLCVLLENQSGGCWIYGRFHEFHAAVYLPGGRIAGI